MVGNKTRDLLGLLFWIALTFGVAYMSSQFEPGPWYQTISKPSWTPPGWVFGPVWGLLYLAMSISAWLVWRQRTRTSVEWPLGFYILQLTANGFWSWLFFGRQLIGVALIDLLVLVLLVGTTTVLFIKVRRTAGLLFVPYLLWVCFAAVLNYQIWKLN